MESNRKKLYSRFAIGIAFSKVKFYWAKIEVYTRQKVEEHAASYIYIYIYIYIGNVLNRIWIVLVFVLYIF